MTSHDYSVYCNHYFFHVYSVYSLLKDHHFPSACEQQGKVFGLSLAQALWALPRCLAWQPGSRKHDESSGNPKKYGDLHILFAYIFYFILCTYVHRCNYVKHYKRLLGTGPTPGFIADGGGVTKQRWTHGQWSWGFQIEIGSPTVRDQSCHT